MQTIIGNINNIVLQLTIQHIITKIQIKMSKKKQLLSPKKQNPISSPKSLKKLPQKPMTSLQKTKRILLKVQERLINDLDKQSINIPSIKIPLLKTQQAASKNNTYRKQLQRLQKIKQQKEQIKRKLYQIQSNQKLLHSQLQVSRIRERNSANVRPRSQLSAQDIQKLKKLKHQQKRFEKQLQQKTRAYEQNLKQSKLQEQQLLERSKKQKNEKKKQQIKKRLKQIQIRQNQRLHKFQLQKKNLSVAKLQRRLHQQLNNKWQQFQRKQQQQKIKQYQERKKQKSVDFQQIKQHQKKYEQILQKNRQEVSKKRFQASRVQHQLFKNKLHRSKFYTSIVQEQQLRKNKQFQQKQAKITFLQKKKQFAELVKQNYAPRTKIRQQESEQQKNQKKIPLDLQSFRQKGLQYLQQAKNKANRNVLTEKSSQMSKITYSNQQKRIYKDYLTESRNNRHSPDGRSMNFQRDYNLQVQQARKIMKQTNFSDVQKLQRVKMLAQRMQALHPKTSNSSNLLKKIQAKMQILQTIQ